mmetsp:Transcript_51133/g.147552  ORF Transcript_51133/g.147552 Transcript_51133/m.147552 type:complete len:247 (+) Transcript_51133:54-794(+)
MHRRQGAASLLVMVGSSLGRRSPIHAPTEDDLAPIGMHRCSPDYGSGATYWDERYKKSPEPYDWLEEYSNMAWIEREMQGNRSARILHAGCGNSLMPEEMYDQGYRNIVNIDTSAVVIAQMESRNQLRPGMQWRVMDAISTDFDDGEFDVVIEKSLIDTFDCAADDATPLVSSFLQEVARILKPGGVFVCISLGTPKTRLSFFEESGVDFEVAAVEISPRRDYAYIARVRQPLSGVVGAQLDRHRQ